MTILFCAALFFIIAIYLYNLPVFGGKANGKRLVRMKQSPNYHEGVFQNLSPTPALAEGYSMPRVMWEFLTDKTAGKRPDHNITTVKTNLKD